MAVVWLILKILLWILLGILGLVLLVLILPITADLKYSAADGFSAAVGTLGLRYPVFPLKESKKKTGAEKQGKKEEAKAIFDEVPGPETPKEETEPPKQKSLPKEAQFAEDRKSEKSVKQKPAVQQHPQPQAQRKAQAEEKKAERDLHGMLHMAVELVSIAGRAMRIILSGLWIHQIRLYLPIYAGDAAQTAIRVGKIHAGAGAGLGFLNRFLHLSFKQYEIVPDYTGERENQGFFSCKITSSLIIMVIAAVWALPKVLKVLKNPKIQAGALPGR